MCQRVNKDAVKVQEEPEQGSVCWDGADLLFCHCYGTLYSEKEQMSIIFLFVFILGSKFCYPGSGSHFPVWLA